MHTLTEIGDMLTAYARAADPDTARPGDDYRREADHVAQALATSGAVPLLVELLADIDHALADEHRDTQTALESIRARLGEIVGEPTPPALTLARPEYTAPAPAPFDRIVITHTDGTRETLDVPERVQGCAHAAGTAGCRLGPHRWHATLRAAGYRDIGRPDDAPEGVTAIERITDGN